MLRVRPPIGPSRLSPPPCAARAVDVARMPVELPGESAQAGEPAEAAASTDPFVARRNQVRAAVEIVAAAD